MSLIGSRRQSQHWSTLVWVLPTLALLALFLYYPLLENLRLSFFQWTVFNPAPQFVGVDNYATAFVDPVFWTALRNNLAYAAVSLVVQVGGGLVIAALIDRFLIGRAGGFFRSVFFIPATLSITVTGVLFTFIYQPDSGLLNEALRATGLGDLTRSWLGDSATAMGAIIAMSQWQWTGYTAALLLVAIQRIPGETYEAASLDGAGGIRQFFSITVPLLRDMVTVMSIIVVSQAFLLFNEVLVMTNGGPADATQVLGTMVYRSAFAKDDMGYASAISVLMLAITATIAVVQLVLTNRKKVQY